MAKKDKNVIYVIALQPDNALFNNIKRLKSEAKKLVGDQAYLNDAPHLTLYLGYFDNFFGFDKELNLATKKINGYLKKGIRIDGWVIFKDDVITKKQTLVCSITEEASGRLKEVQKIVVSIMKKYRKNIILKRYVQAYSGLGDIEKKNLDEYGFPFVGDIWKPHINIASFDKKAFAEVWENFKNECPKGGYNIDSLNIYKLDENEEKLRLIKKYAIWGI